MFQRQGLFRRGLYALLCFSAGALLAWVMRSSDGRQAAYAEIHGAHLGRLDRNALPGRVVFLGSSTFQGLDLTAISPLAINFSLGGDTLPGLVARARNYRAVQAASALVVNIGLNDVLHNCEPVDAAGIGDLIELWPGRRPVLLIGLQGVGGSTQQGRCDGRLRELIMVTNAAYEQYCKRRSACVFVASPIPADEAAPGMHEEDGVHLSPHAYQLLSERIRNGLAQLLPELTPASSVSEKVRR